MATPPHNRVRARTGIAGGDDHHHLDHAGQELAVEDFAAAQVGGQQHLAGAGLALLEHGPGHEDGREQQDESELDQKEGERERLGEPLEQLGELAGVAGELRGLGELGRPDEPQDGEQGRPEGEPADGQGGGPPADPEQFPAEQGVAESRRSCGPAAGAGGDRRGEGGDAGSRPAFLLEPANGQQPQQPAGPRVQNRAEQAPAQHRRTGPARRPRPGPRRSWPAASSYRNASRPQASSGLTTRVQAG